MKENKIATLIFVLFALSACAAGGGVKDAGSKDDAQRVEERRAPVPPVPKPRTAQPPGWVLGKGHPSYPLSRYAVGVGVSESSSVAANESARSELAKSLKVEIQSEMKDTATSEWTYVEEIIKTKVKTRLEGLDIRDGWRDPDRDVYYALAAIDRNLLAAVFRDQIKDAETGLKNHMDEGTRAEDNGEVIGALAHYYEGYRLAPNLDSLKKTLRVVVRSPETVVQDLPSLTAEKFSARIAGIVQTLKIAPKSGDKQEVKTIKSQLAPLVASVYLEKGTQRIPVRNVPAIFEYEKGAGELTREQASGPAGELETAVHSISSFAEPAHLISVKLDFPKIAANFDPEMVRQFLEPLKNVKTTFGYFIKVIATGPKTQDWHEGMVNLANQIIKNLSPEGNPRIGVIAFKDQRSDKATTVGRLLKDDFTVALAQAENLTVKEAHVPKNSQASSQDIAKSSGVDFYVTGSYRMGKKDLDVQATLSETGTGHIKSSGHIQIGRESIPAEDLAALAPGGGFAEKPDAAPQSRPENYEESLEKLVALKPEDARFGIKVWTDRMEYQIGDNVRFYVKAEESCYLTLLDVTPNGDATVIFPNKFHKDNYIRGGATYEIPEKSYGFQFAIQGPDGMERIKAIATLKPDPLLNLDLDQGFHAIEKNSRGTRSIKVMEDKLSQKSGSEWAAGYAEIFIFNRDRVFTRGARQIPLK